MRTLFFLLLSVGVISSAHTSAQDEHTDDYFPLVAAPEHHKALLENEFVLVLDVSIPPGATVPAHLHPWPAVFITLEQAHLVFRNLKGAIVRESNPITGTLASPQVDWRMPDTEPASVTNLSDHAQRAIRIELKVLGA